MKFNSANLLAGLVLFASVVGFSRLLAGSPDRTEVGERKIPLLAEPVSLRPSGFAPLELRGAWRLTADDPRFGGVSGLAVSGDRLIAITDSGVIADFPMPPFRNARVTLRELPAGPGNPSFKVNRDAEALLADPAGRGWWVAFENREELWLYDRWFRRPLAKLALPIDPAVNRGVEGLAADGSELLAIPEAGGELVRIAANRSRRQRIEGWAGGASEAATLPDGSIWIVERLVSFRGFANALIRLDRGPDGNLRAGRRIRLGVGPLDNLEGLAAQSLPDGRTRLWLVTDDNGQKPLRTLLVALDLPPRGSSTVRN